MTGVAVAPTVSPADLGSLTAMHAPAATSPAGPHGVGARLALSRVDAHPATVEVSSSIALDELSQVGASAIPAFVTSHRAAFDALLTHPPAAVQVETSWALLDPQRQQSLITAAPHIIGNLDGVPFAVRGQANRIDLGRTLASTRKRLDDPAAGTAVRIGLRQKLETLTNIQKALHTAGGAASTLVVLDTTSNARAGIVVGDLSTAHYVSYLVPGMYMSVDQQIEGWARTARDLYATQTDFLHGILGPRGGQATPGVAVVAWIGYQTPELMNIGGLDLATEGADQLGRALDGLRALRTADEPYVSVMAHSYGSTAALVALERHTVSVDALALLGSPGSDAQSVAALDVKGGNVFVAQAAMDPIVHSAFFGADPGTASYGAKKMGVDGGTDPLTHRQLAGSLGHNDYFTPGTESMRNLALIGIGQGRLVMGGSE